LIRRLTAELVGTAFLLAAVVGSGAMAERLTDDVALQLLANTLATVGALVALIVALGPVSGAHLNPAVTLADRVLGGIGTRVAIGYVAAQLVGGALGVVVANAMFELPLVAWSTTERSSGAAALAEGVATLGLLLVVFGAVRSRTPVLVAPAVGGYIASAYWFTSSTSFANPAVTVGRTLTDSFAGIEPASVPTFVAAQLAAVVVGVALVRVLFPDVEAVADRVVVPRASAEEGDGVPGDGELLVGGHHEHGDGGSVG